MFDQMIGSGEPLTEAALASAENEISRKIPGPFRAFLLKYNGGRPDAADFAMAARGGATQPGTIKSFFGIGMPERTFNLDYVLQTFGDRIPAWSFPIASG